MHSSPHSESSAEPADRQFSRGSNASAPLSFDRSADLAVLEQRLGYAFGDRKLLGQALTHRSAGADNFERLEFLGDAALGFAVGQVLFDAMADASEQTLTLMRAHLVNASALASTARELDLGAFLNLGMGERKSGVAQRTSVLADALEAVFGAIVCDGGLEAAAMVIQRLFDSRLAALDDEALKDPKTRLQEYVQARRLALPKYDIVDATGKDHARFYCVECVVDDLEVRARGSGRSRREAEKNAAGAILDRLEGA